MEYCPLVLISPYLLKVVRYTPVQPTVLRTKLDHSGDRTMDGEELFLLRQNSSGIKNY